MFCPFYLELAAKLATAVGPRASSGEDSDDGTADVVETLASSTMSSSTPRPTSCPPEVPRHHPPPPTPPPPPPPLQKKTKSSSFPSTAGGLRERNDDSLKLQERIEALLDEQAMSRNSRVQFGLYLTSMIPHIHNSILVDFLNESHRLLLQYVRQSDMIKLQETQQQQQQPYHLPLPDHPSHQRQLNAHDMFQQQPVSTLQQVPKFQHILFQHSFPVQPVSITEVRPVATSSSSTSTSTATSGSIFDPSVSLASLAELQSVMPLTPSTSSLCNENVNLNTPQPGSLSEDS